MTDKKNQAKKAYSLPCMCLGMSLGIGIGIATNSSPVLMPVGLGVGLCIGVMIDAKNRKRDKEIKEQET